MAQPKACLDCAWFWEYAEDLQCLAYPEGIPERYITAQELHDTVQEDQQGDFVFDPLRNKEDYE